jgi:dTDP-4-dehydrorhamnose reductase
VEPPPVTVVVLGATGMLGHVVTCVLREEGRQVVAQGRSALGIASFDEKLRLLDVTNRPALFSLLSDTAPCTVINCVAARPGSAEHTLAAVNSELPHWLANTLAEEGWGRLIQISTDGVFARNQRDATEDDIPSPPDSYGRSKLAGEVARTPHLTIRTSIIGPECRERSGLFEWFRGGETPVSGYSGVLWNGVTTLEMARFLSLCLDQKIAGLVHLGGETVTKLELLRLIGTSFGIERQVLPTDAPKSDRTLKSIRPIPGYVVPPLATQLNDLRSWILRQDLAIREHQEPTECP